MSKHDGKYGYAPAEPKAFRSTQSIAGGCIGCNDSIHVNDWVVYFEDKLYHEECGLDEWELTL